MDEEFTEETALAFEKVFHSLGFDAFAAQIRLDGQWHLVENASEEAILDSPSDAMDWLFEAW